MTPGDLAFARLERLADLVNLDRLAQDQIDYLAHVDELEDPVTDGIDCGAQVGGG
jgi:hypothetical protein